MTVSLLHPGGIEAAHDRAEERLLCHLSLDRTFAHICTDIRRREIFFSVLTDLTADRAEIEYRQEILQDFLRSPTLLEDLRAIFPRFTELQAEQKTAGREIYRMGASHTNSPVGAKNLLQARALCLKRALCFIESFGDLLDRHTPTARGLREFRDACRAISDSPPFRTLLTACDRYAAFSANGFLDFRFSLDPDGRIAAYALIDHRHLRIPTPALQKRGLSLRRRETEPPAPCVPLAPQETEAYDALTVSALSALTAIFSSASAQIFARFAPIARELEFYSVAAAYARALAETGIPHCFPRITPDAPTDIRGLCDLFLLITSHDPHRVVPNDFTLSPAGGLALFGENGSGKTVYLRAIATAQLLAQAGLPIPCTAAEISPCTGIAAQFSEAEKDFAPGTDAGRFEQEVRELARMVDRLQPGAMVFLNETFQSTAYAEGAEGLYHLLRHFSACGIRWVLVSHLRHLEKMLSPDEAALRHTAEGYRIIGT